MQKNWGYSSAGDDSAMERAAHMVILMRKILQKRYVPSLDLRVYHKNIGKM
jgi:hypothetical protein